MPFPILETISASSDNVLMTLPHAVGPEKSLLSSMLQEPQEFIGRAIEEKITADHFYLPAHSTLFGFLIDSFEKNQEVELVSFIQRLNDSGKLAAIGGTAIISDLYTYAPSPGQFGNHLKFVQEKYKLRAIISACNEAIADAYDNPESASDLIDALESKMLCVREDSSTFHTLKRAGDELRHIIDELTAIVNNEPYEGMGLATGYAEIDSMSGGLRPGEMFVVAARPSVGKTSFMMNIVEHVAVDLGKMTMVFSCEMPRLQVVNRLAYSRSKISLASLKHGQKPTRGDLLRMQRAAIEIKGSPLWIDDRAGMTIQEIRAKARRMHRKSPLALIAIDYLQLVHSRSKQAGNSREREIGEVSAGIKELAKELNVPVLVLAQLNRDAEKRTGAAKGVPRLSDLRESGTIEQDADVVGLLHRAAYSADSEAEALEKAGIAELHIAKNRNGATGRCPLTFIENLMRFETGKPVIETSKNYERKSRYSD